MVCDNGVVGGYDRGVVVGKSAELVEHGGGGTSVARIYRVTRWRGYCGTTGSRIYWPTSKGHYEDLDDLFHASFNITG